jgi:hypothetical protein
MLTAQAREKMIDGENAPSLVTCHCNSVLRRPQHAAGGGAAMRREPFLGFFSF